MLNGLKSQEKYDKSTTSLRALFRVLCCYVNAAAGFLNKTVADAGPWVWPMNIHFTFLMCCKSTCSGVGAKKVPHNVILRRILVRFLCAFWDAIKGEVLRAKFLELRNGFCGRKTPKDIIWSSSTALISCWAHFLHTVFDNFTSPTFSMVSFNYIHIPQHKKHKIKLGDLFRLLIVNCSL